MMLLLAAPALVPQHSPEHTVYKNLIEVSKVNDVVKQKFNMSLNYSTHCKLNIQILFVCKVC
jgi:hypothetical protein